MQKITEGKLFLIIKLLGTKKRNQTDPMKRRMLVERIATCNLLLDYGIDNIIEDLKGDKKNEHEN